MASNSGEQTATPFSWSTHTCSGTHRAVWVGVSVRANPAVTVTGITYDGVPMHFLRRDGSGAANSPNTELWYLENPNTTANATITVTLSGTPSDVSAGAISYSEVDQTTPNDVAGGAGTNGTGTAASQSITTVTDNALTLSVLMVHANATIVIQNGDTQVFDLAFGSVNGEASMGRSPSNITPAGSKTMGWTFGSDDWAISVAAVRPFTAGGTTPTPYFYRQHVARTNVP